jgi:hypothetical protein
MNNRDWLYENNEENTVRYILGTKGENPLICFGINPSTAEPENLDNTLKSVEKLALNNGFDSWVMLNIYPQRATDPNNIHKDFDILIHESNLTMINKLLSELQNPTIWAAWGTLIKKRPFLIECLKDIHKLTSRYNCSWVTIGNLSVNGHPHHPLYLSSTTSPEPFKIDEYVKKYVA